MAKGELVYMEHDPSEPKAGECLRFQYDGAVSIPEAAKFRSHDGQSVTVLSRYADRLADPTAYLYHVRFPDGWETIVWWDELEVDNG